MNKTILMGRLTRDPDIRYTQSKTGEQLAIAHFSLAVDRRFAKKGSDPNEPTADFFECNAFGRQAEFAEKYLKQGTKILVTGRLENNNYTNKNNERVYSVRVMVEEVEFAESKNASQNAGQGGYQPQMNMPVSQNAGDFIAIPDGIENDLPFGNR